MCFASGFDPGIGAWDFGLGPWAFLAYGVLALVFLAAFAVTVLHLVRTPQPERPEGDEADLAAGGAARAAMPVRAS
ncbi:MAG: hypothetical protein HY521_03385 [Proteobacteria bacterium]|nr:hypothetical protein [Pseudomonadota bacterium]